MSRLARLLNPKTITLIGGSWTKNVEDQLRRQNFTGLVYRVHPKGAFKTVDDLPVVPDAAFIAVNRTAAVQVTASLSAQGAGGAICFASGFEEAGTEGADLQAQLLEAAGDMPLLGPNCYGLVNCLDNVALWPDVHGGGPVDSGVALITQSSNILINMSMQQRGLPLAYLLAAGNGAQVGLPELIAAVDADPRVTAIGLHIEGFGDAEAFHRACRLTSKPILALKAGETEAAQALTVSHTASLSGSDAVASAFLERCGVGRVFSLEALMEGLKVLHAGGPLKEKTLASVSCSGGEASLMADQAARHGFAFPSLDGLGIGETLNPLVHVSNPFDYHTFDWGDPEALIPAFTKVMKGPQAISVFVLDWPREGSGDVTGFETAIECIIKAKQASGARVAVLASYPENMPEGLAYKLISEGLIPLNGMAAGLEGLAAACLPVAAGFNPLKEPAGPRHQLSEHAAKQDLKAAGISVPDGYLAHTQDDLSQRTFPRTVMKAVSETLAHKSDVGGVVLDVQNLAETFTRLSALAPVVLVEEMVQDVVTELIVGLAHDPVIGGHLVVGAGGVLTELLEDTAILLLPFDRRQALDALEGLKVHKLLQGYRGKPAADLNALADALVTIEARIERGDIFELDINPLMVTPKSAVAADALMIAARKETK